jgi:uncharacterized surface protein with fasciclin (FAS1) repeats
MTKQVGLILVTLLASLSWSCSKKEAAPGGPAAAPAGEAAAKPAPPPADDTPPLDPNNIVSIAMASKDHTTLVAALKAADYVTAIANPGPLTVFAPTNAAFDKLPPGTVEGLLKPEKQADLKNILEYHATTSVYMADGFKDGQVLAMANGAKATIHVVDGKITINDANIVASVRASNGVVHIIDAVLLPPAPAP